MSFNFANYVRLDIPEGRVKKITCKSDGTVLWTAGYVNQVPLSIDSSGEIYNGTGYKNGYRIRSGGAEGALGDAVCTGFIPVSGGDVVRLSGWTFSHVTAGNAINLADSAFTNLGQVTSQGNEYGIMASTYKAYGWSSVVEESDGVWKWVVPPAASGVAYIRVSGFDNSTYADETLVGTRMIVTVNEEIT